MNFFILIIAPKELLEFVSCSCRKNAKCNGASCECFKNGLHSTGLCKCNRCEKIDQLWKKSLNSCKEAFWQQYKAKNFAETFSELLNMEPPQMLRKFLQKEIKNESEEETKIRKELAMEKVKNPMY